MSNQGKGMAWIEGHLNPDFCLLIFFSSEENEKNVFKWMSNLTMNSICFAVVTLFLMCAIFIVHLAADNCQQFCLVSFVSQLIGETASLFAT